MRMPDQSRWSHAFRAAPLRWRLLTLGLTLVLIGACASLDELADGLLGRSQDPDEPTVSVDPGPGGAFALPTDGQREASSLRGFDACDDLHDHLMDAALDQVGPWGLGGDYAVAAMTEDAVDADRSASEEVVAAPETPADGGFAPPIPQEGEVSGTNIQEQGVDEPDRVKIAPDGAVMYVASPDALRVFDVTGDEPEALAELRFQQSWGDVGLMLHGDRLLLTSSTYALLPFADERTSALPLEPSGATTSMTTIDVSDPGDPTVLERMTVDGHTVSSRMIDGVVRVVIGTTQGNLPWEAPQGSGLRAQRAALNANRDLIRNSEIADWLPYFIHETADGAITERTLLSCARVGRPSQFSGLGMLSVLTVDLDAGLAPGDEAVGILAGGDTVYASTERLYVATARWIDPAPDERARTRAAGEMTTEIHAFDISDPTGTEYLASGSVPGTLLDQWAMSEHDGNLRVASTSNANGGWGGFGNNGEPSSSVVTVLAPEGDALTKIGQVEGLGPTERIYAVRFFGDVGYVVTFRETDPLYTLDLTDPTDPRVTGELKIMGYSAYLHPMGDDLLLGVGQDADEQGITKGTQVSLFDVADPADPRRIDALTLANGHSAVEHDHRAFLHWSPTGLTVVPFQRWDHDPQRRRDEVSNGAVTFTARRDAGIVPLRTLSHLPMMLGNRAEGDLDGGASALDDLYWDHGGEATITRSVVNGERLITISNAGIAIHRLGDLEDLGWYGFHE